MNVTYTCPHCDQVALADFDASSQHIACPHCDHGMPVPPDAIAGERVVQCLICPSHDLFVRKDFPQGLGLTIVVIGFIGSTIAFYYYQQILAFAVLFVTALIDMILYTCMGNLLQCYRCEAQYRGVANVDDGPEFDLTIHERYRQQELRLAEASGEASHERESHG